jgi:hypothetical protein
MEKEFAPYEPSLVLKDLGFNEPCFRAYGAWGLMSSNDVNPLSDEVTQEDLDNQGYNEEDCVCLAPTFSQAFRFFREKYNLHNGIYPYYDEYEFQIKDFRLSTNTPINGGLMKYEEAELACLNKLIELVKNKS